MCKFRLLCYLVLSLGVTCGVHAHETALDELLHILRTKDVISDEAYQQLIESSAPDRSLEQQGEVLLKTGGGIEVQSYDGAFSAQLGGRLMVDYASYQQDQVALGSGTELRRARIEMEGSLYENWDYELSVDFADASGEVDLKDAYITFNGGSGYRILIGQFKEPFSLEELTSSRYITFMERALPNEFAPGRNIGIACSSYQDHWGITAGLFGQAVDDGDNSEHDEGWGVSARGTYAPWASKREVLHLGLSLARREPDDSGEVSFSSRPESHISDVKYVNTGDLLNVEHYSSVGAEAAWITGPLSLQGEYITTRVSRSSVTDDTDFAGWYVYASYFITGEARRYKANKGKFSAIKPIARGGAWEVALRYSMIDMNDMDISGGEENSTTLGLNWYANKNIRIMFNYILIENDTNADDDADVSGNDDPRIIQARMQLHF